MKPNIVHEFSPTGRHRLVVDGKPGEWRGYQAFTTSACGKFMASTDYHGKAVLHVEHVAGVEDRVDVPEVADPPARCRRCGALETIHAGSDHRFVKEA